MADKVLRETVMKDDKGNEAKVYIGVNPEKYGRNSLRIGEDNTAIEGSVANGYGCYATGSNSHAEGNETTASGFRSHAEGYHTLASEDFSHAEGENTIAGYRDNPFVKTGAHSEGVSTSAFGNNSHAEGSHTLVLGIASHAEGFYTTANGNWSHAEGDATLASGDYSHAEGYNTTAQGDSQFVTGRFNNPNASDLFQIGCGSDSNSKQNAFSIDNEGKAHIYKGLILEDVDISSNNSVLKLNPSNGKNIIIGNNSLVVNNATGSDRGHISIYDNIYFNNLETPTILGMYDTSFSLPVLPSSITLLANSKIGPYEEFYNAFKTSSKTPISMKNWITDFHTKCTNFLTEYNTYKDSILTNTGIEDDNVSYRVLLRGFNRMYPQDSITMSRPSSKKDCIESFDIITGDKSVSLVSNIISVKTTEYPELRFKILEDTTKTANPSVSITVIFYYEK